jgi:hypothetical protein
VRTARGVVSWHSSLFTVRSSDLLRLAGYSDVYLSFRA